VAAAVPAAIADNTGVQGVNLAERAALRYVHGSLKVAYAATLGADLKNTSITTNRVIHGLNF
jgi:hypothetical protein